jgi:hypothetical protein
MPRPTLGRSHDSIEQLRRAMPLRHLPVRVFAVRFVVRCWGGCIHASILPEMRRSGVVFGVCYVGPISRSSQVVSQSRSCRACSTSRAAGSPDSAVLW